MHMLALAPIDAVAAAQAARQSARAIELSAIQWNQKEPGDLKTEKLKRQWMLFDALALRMKKTPV